MNSDVTDPAEAFDLGFSEGYTQGGAVEKLRSETKVAELQAEVRELKHQVSRLTVVNRIAARQG